MAERTAEVAATDELMAKLHAYLSAAMAELDALRIVRAYARHAPLCNYSPVYPDGPVATCTCGFDAALNALDAAIAQWPPP